MHKNITDNVCFGLESEEFDYIETVARHTIVKHTTKCQQQSRLNYLITVSLSIFANKQTKCKKRPINSVFRI